MSSLNAKTYEPAPSQHVAFLGLGVMGYPMAGHLARAGHAVTVTTEVKPRLSLGAKSLPTHVSQPMHPPPVKP